MIVLRIDDRYTQAVTTLHAKKIIRSHLETTPDMVIEAYELTPTAALNPTPTEREKARERRRQREERERARQEGYTVAENQRRLAAIEEEAANLRLRLGLSS